MTKKAKARPKSTIARRSAARKKSLPQFEKRSSRQTKQTKPITSILGRMKGTITYDADLTQPTGEMWNAEADKS